MKKVIALFLLLVFVLCGCSKPKDNNNSSSDNQQTETNNSSVTNKNPSPSNNQRGETNNSSIKIEISTGNETVDKLFSEFLSGEKKAVDKDRRTITINEYLDTTTENPYQKYAVYDMSGDNIPELIIKTPRAFDIFMIKDNTVTLWHQGAWYSKPLNNMAVLYERPGGAPEHTYYQYYKLGPNGEEIEKITFAIYSATEVYGVKYDETYYVNDEKVSKETYDSIAKPILALSDDKIIWKDLSNSPLAEAKAVGVISLGSYDDYNQYTEKIKTSKYLSENAFLGELTKDKFITASAGTETFAIIPANDVALVCVYKLVYDQELNKTQSGDLLYSSPNADPIVVKCNFSDIYSDVNIKIVQKNGTVTEFSPRISMKDGKLEIVSEAKEAVADLTKY